MRLPRPHPRRAKAAFSLVEVAMALGLIAFVMVSIIALMVVGMKNNQVSAEESRAICILSAMEADLRNTHPLANDGKSAIYGLELPYEADGTTRKISYNSNLVGATVPTTPEEGSTMVYLDEGERDVGLTGAPIYQASVIYTAVPTAAAPYRTMQARLVVNWPVLAEGDEETISNLTDPAKVRGYVETLVSFPAP